MHAEITVHVGKRKYYQVTGTGVVIASYRNPDPALLTVTVNGADHTEFAVDGVATGNTSITMNTVNGSAVVAEPLELLVNVVPATAVTIGNGEINSEANAGTAFP